MDAFLKKEVKPFLRIETNLLEKLSNLSLAKFTMKTVFNELHLTSSEDFPSLNSDLFTTGMVRRNNTQVTDKILFEWCNLISLKNQLAKLD